MSASPESPEITAVQVYGNYASGTNFFHSLLLKNILGLTLYPQMNDDGVIESFSWKHGDVGEMPSAEYGKVKLPSGEYSKDELLLPATMVPLDHESSANALLCVVTRNPIDWLRSFHGKPHHAPAHWGLSLDDFVRRRWEAYALHFGCENFSREAAQPFLPRLALSKKIEDFDSPFHLRNERNRLFAGFGERFQNMTYINYEALGNIAMQEAHIRTIAQLYNLEITDEFHPINGYKGGREPYKPQQYPHISSSLLRHIIDPDTSPLDWDLEAKLGYELNPEVVKKFRRNGVLERPEELIQTVLPSPRCYELGSVTLAGVVETPALTEVFAE